jgi:hypothetical protein
MAIIRATCQTCGDVQMGEDEIVVRLCSDTMVATYSFACPVCHMRTVRVCRPEIVELLNSHGVQVLTWRLPQELQEPHHGAPISYDDMLAFHALIGEAGWLERQLAGG